MSLVATPEQLAETERLRRMYPNAPEFANDTFAPNPFLTGQMAIPAPSMPSRNVLADVMRPQQSTSEPAKRKRSFNEIVGRVGDILAIMGGQAPVYDAYMRREREDQEQQALRAGFEQYMRNPNDQSIAARLIRAGASVGDLKAARSLFAPESAASGPASIQEIEYLNNPNIPLERREQLRTLINNRALSGALLGGPDTGYTINPLFQPLGGSAPQTPQAPAASQPAAAEVEAVNPATGETLVLRNGQWVPKGGAGVTASGGF
jgi:CheY-like chemotaxis protein